MIDDRPRVVITGMGVVSAGGCDLASFWQRLVSGVPSIGRVRRFDVSAYPSQIAAEIDDEAFERGSSLPVEWHSRGRIARYAASASSAAIADAGLMRDHVAPERVGVSLAAGMGSYDHREVFGPCGVALAPGTPDFDWPAFTSAVQASLRPRCADRRTPGSIPALVASDHGFCGPVMGVMTACAGATQAIGDAMRWIRAGRADVVVAGGADSELYPMGLASFCLLGALSRRNDAPAQASRPFDGERDGFVMGEGAGVLVLEEHEHALRRGARIYAEAAGFGSASDAYRVTDPHPEGVGAVLAMERALRDADAVPDDVDYVNAHGTSTVANDRIETAALKRIFGSRSARVPTSSTKSMIGHATVAAGGLEAIATALTLAHQVIHPTINQAHPDEACDLDYVPNHARFAAVDVALSNSFAFGGQTASLVFRRHGA